jgi:hypothetical protein
MSGFSSGCRRTRNADLQEAFIASQFRAKQSFFNPESKTRGEIASVASEGDTRNDEAADFFSDPKAMVRLLNC